MLINIHRARRGVIQLARFTVPSRKKQHNYCRLKVGWEGDWVLWSTTTRWRINYRITFLQLSEPNVDKNTTICRSATGSHQEVSINATRKVCLRLIVNQGKIWLRCRSCIKLIMWTIELLLFLRNWKARSKMRGIVMLARNIRLVRIRKMFINQKTIIKREIFPASPVRSNINQFLKEKFWETCSNRIIRRTKVNCQINLWRLLTTMRQRIKN